jgi:catechol 2,3-dioxygenase-like lactoylglutathione lyase family enzyme
MIIGVHAMLYSRDAAATRAFMRDAMGLRSVDAGEGWLIFELPPTELGVHPSDEAAGPELYLLCDALEPTIAQLEKHGAKRSGPTHDAGWGRVTTIEIPGEVSVGIYEPRHPLAIRRAAE